MFLSERERELRVLFAGEERQRDGVGEGCECSFSGGLKLSFDSDPVILYVQFVLVYWVCFCRIEREG